MLHSGSSPALSFTVHEDVKVYDIWPQTSTYTHTFVQCSPASVGLAQTRPNYSCAFVINTDARLQLFGSSANGFGSFKSDLDICMTLDGNTDVRIVTLTCSKLCMVVS